MRGKEHRRGSCSGSNGGSTGATRGGQTPAEGEEGAINELRTVLGENEVGGDEMDKWIVAEAEVDDAQAKGGGGGVSTEIHRTPVSG